MNPGRFWGVFFGLMMIGYIANTYFATKKMIMGRMGLLSFLVFLSLPYFMWLMLSDEHLTMGEKIVDSILGLSSIVSGILYLYIFKKGKW